MDADVKALVVHTVLADAGTQTGVVATHQRLPSVTSSYRRIHRDVGADEIGLFFRKP